MGKISTFGLTVAAIGLFVSPVSAQSSLPKNAPPSKQASASTPAPATTRTSPVTVEDRALAKDIVLLFSTEEDSREMLATFFAISPEQFISQSPQMKNLEKQFPGIVALLLNRMQDWFSLKFDEVYQGSINAQVDALAQNMTTEQLRQSKAFFATPAGQSFIALTLNNVIVDEETITAGMGRKFQNKDSSAENFMDFDEGKFLQEFTELPEDQVEATIIFLESSAGEQFLFALDEAEKARLNFVDQFIASHADELEALSLTVFDDYQKGVR